MKKSILTALAALIVSGTAYAETATLELGDFDNATEYYEGSISEVGIPVNYCYTYSGGQIFYPNNLIKDIADKSGEITSLTFRYLENGDFYDGDFEGTSTIWAQATDLNAAPSDDPDKKWISYTSGSKATTSIDYSITYSENVYEITYTFSTPIKLAPGKSLLVTASSEITCDLTALPDNFKCYCFKAGDGRQTLFYGSDRTDFEADVTAGNPYQWYSSLAPVVKITYNYVDKLPQAEAPVFTPATGTALGPDDKVIITAAEGAKILYTLEKDGTPDIPYTAPISLDKAATITAIATADGCDPSDPVSATYTLNVAGKPAFVIPSGTTLGANEKVTVSAAEGTKVLYTLKADAEPDTEFPAEGLTLTADATVTIMATAEGAYPSATTSAEYSVTDLEATLVGDYYAMPGNDNLFEGTNWYNAPIVPTYANSASQLLYLPEEIKGMGENATITAINFRYHNETCFTEYTSTAKVYIQAVDDKGYPYDNINEKYRWFATDLESPLATQTLEIDFMDSYGHDGKELVFTIPGEGFDVPAGKSLLLTFVNEAETPLENSEYPQFFKYNYEGDHRSANFASDKMNYAASLAITDYITSGDGYFSGTCNRDMPCVKFFTKKKVEDGISVVGSDNAATDAPVEYYNLQGIRLDKAPSGTICIMRQGNNVQKVIVK